MQKSIGPILLIAVGTALLLSNLGYIRIGMLKEIAREWWPALLIVIGLLQLRRR
ncbi:MAG: LiaI-LiaF-like domain-containing protein [Desulfopila sp.]